MITNYGADKTLLSLVYLKLNQAKLNSVLTNYGADKTRLANL